MRRLSIAPTVLLCATLMALPAAGAQSAATPGAAWQSIVDAQSASPIDHAPNPSDERQIAASAAEQRRLETLASLAHDFYTRFPADPHAADARKKEAIALLQAVQLGDAAVEPKARSLASALRADQTLRQQDRIEVALAQFATDRTRAPGPLMAWETEADALHQEFGDSPEVFSVYLNVAQTSDAATAKKVVAKLQTWSLTPEAQAQAARILGQSASVGTHAEAASLGLPLKQKDLEAAGAVTVLYFWNAGSSGPDLGALDAVKAKLPSAARFIFVQLGGTAPVSHPNLSLGATTADSRTFDAPAARAFGVSRLPFVVVLRGNGNVSGLGEVSALPALVTAALP